MPLFDLDDAKSLLDITDTSFDAELQGFIDSAIEAVDFLCGPTSPTTVTETHEVTGNAISLSTRPFIELLSVTGQRYGTVDVSRLYVGRPTSGIVRARYGSWLYPDVYEVTFTAGWATPPASLARGAKIIFRHQWDTQRRNFDDATDLDLVAVPGLGFAIPRMALQILDPYLLGPSVG